MSKSSAEFGDITPESVEHCLEFGASKISGFLSVEEIEIIKANGLRFLELDVSEHTRLTRLVDAFKISGLPNVSVSPVALYPNNSGFNPGIHTDQIGDEGDARSLFGLTLLVPFRGPQATFESGSLATRVHGQFPDYRTTYGIGDVMLLRQYVTSYNGAQVYYPPAHHQGICDEPRFVVAIDLNESDLEVNFTA